MRARWYPFDMPKRRFQSFNPKVCQAFRNISCQYITWYPLYIKVYTQIYVVYHSFSTYQDVLYFFVQDTTLVVPPYPFCIEEDRHDAPLEDCWYARPHLFFTCFLWPKDGRLPKNRTYKTGHDDIVYTLVFFSTFEELKLPIKGPMEDAGVIKLYEPCPTPCLYVADVQNMVGRVPLMPLFLAGNSTPTIPSWLLF